MHAEASGLSRKAEPGADWRETEPRTARSGMVLEVVVAHGHWGWSWGIGAWWWMLLMAGFWIAVIVAIVLLVPSLAGGGTRPGHDPKTGARQILAERYAQGEIDSDEYAERLRTLDSQT
jgi:putative membrane protein